MEKIKISWLALTVVFVMSQVGTAQIYYQDTHFHNVPHTTTHTDYIPHNGHFDAVPHTTTHIDQLPHTTFRPTYQYPSTQWQQPYNTYQPYPLQQQYVPQQNYYPQTYNYPSQQYYPQQYVPHTTTHLDYVPHNGHIDVMPHTTTHFDYYDNH